MSVTRTGAITEIHSAANSGSQAITVPADAEIMVCGVAGTVAEAISDFFSGNAPTIGGAAMSVGADLDNDDTRLLCCIFYKASPATGSQTFAWNWGGASNMPIGGHILIAFYKGIDIASPIRSSGGAQDVDNSATTGSLAASSGDAAFAVAAAFNATTLPTIDWTNATELDDDANNSLQGACAEAFPGGNVAITATHNGGSGGSPNTTIAAVVLRQLFTVSASGSDAPTGAIIKQPNTAYTGQIGPSGEPDLGVQTTLAGSVAPSGSLAVLRIVLLALDGTVTATGNLIRQANRLIDGAITGAGNIIRDVLTAYAGQTTPTGEPDLSVQTSLAGSVVPTGGIIKSILTAYTGQVGADGEPNLGVQTSLAGSVTPGGVLAVARVVLLDLAGSITGAGSLVKSVLVAFVGQVDPSGNPIAGVQTSFSGSVTASGVLSLISSAVTLVETIFKGMFRGMFKGMR